MKAVILAGGKGTRLQEKTNVLPKPMIPIGDKPLLEHQIKLLARYGIKDITILVNYLKESIIDYFREGENWGVSIRYFEEKEPLGTVGGIKEIEKELNSDFMVLYGDVMIEMNLSKLIEFHKQHKSECTLVIHPNDHPYDSDLVEMNTAHKVVAFHAKPHKPDEYYKNLVNAGMYVFSPVILKYLEKGKKADFGKDVFPKILNKIAIHGYNTAEYLKDMGTPERLEQVSTDYFTGKITRFNSEVKRKAIFLDRDGVINEERSFIHQPEDLVLYPFAAKAIYKINQSEYLSIIITNQSVIARNLCTLEELDYVHKKIETELGKARAKIDALYFCPHHPDSGFPEENKAYKIDCECRKPKPGMIYQARKELNIDLPNSFFIGDTERDIKAGKAAGCNTVGVMTGYGVKKAEILPDFFFKDLLEAVNFILEDKYYEHFQHILSRYKNYPGVKPFVINIGGNTRTGKSNFASYLKMRFKQEGLNVSVISLDNWILPPEMRTHCKNVYDRFQVSKIEADLEDFFAGEKIYTFFYVNHIQREDQILKFELHNEDIILIEGVVALSTLAIREYAIMKVFLEISEDTFIRRLNEYYTWRHYTEDEIKILYKQRKKDEYRHIQKERKFADLIIKI